ncbi:MULTISPECIES: ABC transporter permease [unclassified Microbacterium]|uniref:ABC transporter permease n=1 Tax=unclassified Microbacterium TaxID=2609290 RepID=UPI00097EB5B1|nr:ABC transporter permease [Microbacterium sp. JB110]RCS63159.1 molybdate ABC transporter permease subunit [Microbacterium sp. JB110]SJM52774.1 Molybdenum transport system permease protein ModB (TC 3.A.1.8.1) [Frigoribacterium sp. JB110]
MSDVRSGTARTEAGPRRRASPPGQLPRILAVPALVGIAMLVLPLAALVGRVEWTTVWGDVTSPASLEALWLSVRTALVATGICLVLGVPLALLIARSARAVAAVLRALVTIPLVLPPMVGGVALLFLLGPTGPGGSLLAEVGIQIPFTTTAVVLAQVFVALPFLVLALEGALRSVGTEFELAAAGLGAGRWRILARITLPLAAPGLIAGTVLCFARAVGEFGATALFAGNAPGVTRTMPLAIYTAFNGSGLSQGPAVALSLLLLMTAILVLLLVRAWRPGAMR